MITEGKVSVGFDNDVGLRGVAMERGFGTERHLLLNEQQDWAVQSEVEWPNTIDC
jgi:hypothetical protein